ncbi:MAG TPA: undecaprenyl-diphosphate phosphatase [Tepidisphaeraceae bacterium]|nr:undecaprenyl-diphosphate phosphatase [Tepidisphaeraceae bacterium]
MDILVAIALGIIEGITEFLPVSSTAHLRIAQGWLFHQSMDDPFWKMFAIVIQFGAILCLPTYFWSRIMKLIRTFPRGENGDRTIFTHPLSLVMIGFACTSVPALLLKKVISANLENLQVIGAALLIGGAVMWAVDALFQSPKTLEMEKINLLQAIWIGLVQTLAAVFPGTSRSMATIAAGQTAGLSRATALEFSFFLSMPTMAAACLYDLYKSLKPSHDVAAVPVHMTPYLWFILLVGVVVSYIVALVVVAWFMHWVRRRGFVPFAVYRIILGAVLLIVLRNQTQPAPVAVDSQPAITYSLMP